MNEENLSIWMRFSKTGNIRFISHLDLTRTFHRALIRAGIPLKTSSGFSPHPKFAFALPLSVGMESLAEFAVFTLAEGAVFSAAEIREKLQAQMPAGIEILEVRESKGKFPQIAAARYEIFLSGAASLAEASQKLFDRDVILVEKRTKKGDVVPKNIRPSILSLKERPCGGDLVLEATLAASGEEYLTPELFIRALQAENPETPLEEKRIRRLAVLLADGNEL